MEQLKTVSILLGCLEGNPFITTVVKLLAGLNGVITSLLLDPSGLLDQTFPWKLLYPNGSLPAFFSLCKLTSHSSKASLHNTLARLHICPANMEAWDQNETTVMPTIFKSFELRETQRLAALKCSLLLQFDTIGSNNQVKAYPLTSYSSLSVFIT